MPRTPGRRLIIAGVLLIATATLLPGGGGESSGCILCGERGLSDFLANVLLFAPLGFALVRRGHSLARAVAVCCLFSLGIEVAQLDLIAGRDANAGDVLANTLGGVLGGALGHSRHWWTSAARSTRDCLVATLVTLAALAGGLALFIPSLPATTYYMQWTPVFGNMARYKGHVLSARLGPLPLPGPARIEQGDSVRRMLFSQPLEVVATAAMPGGLAPIVSIYDERQKQIMLLGAARADLIFRYRMIADELRLDRGDLRVHQAFGNLVLGSTYALKLSVDRRGYCLELKGRRECGRGFTVGDIWTLLVHIDLGTDERAIMRVLWIWLMFVPAGILASRVRTLAAATAVTAAGLAILPVLLGFAATPVCILVAGAVGLFSGHVFVRRRRADAPPEVYPRGATG